MMKESIKMCDFDHPNVLTLIGVCIDAGPTPYIVTSFMSNGSLQSYLKEHRAELILEEGADEDEVSLALTVKVSTGLCLTTMHVCTAVDLYG